MSDWTAIAELIKDPLLIFLLVVVGILGYVIWALLRTISTLLEQKYELVSEVNANSTTLARLTALIETLVHGRGGPK
jgi:uncharacterized BrkB/YihY/UPF0761 family membrane protein